MTAVIMIGYATWSIFGANGQTLWGFWTIGGLIIVYSFSILDAYRGTQPGYATRISVPRGKSDPWYAVFLSQLLPGLGHLYLQQALAGGIFLITGLLTAWLANSMPQLVPIPPLIWALSCYHVYASFPHRREYGAIALLAIGLLVVRLCLGATPGWVQQAVEQCIVPSNSMTPTLQIDDRLFVRRSQTYRPSFGDIMVFVPPDEALRQLPEQETVANPLYVKRVIGLPGQEIAVREGRVYVGDRPLTEPYVQSAPAYEWGPETVPENSYFVLGDNRRESYDSHVWGYVPDANILGEAYKIYWPPDRVQPLQ